MDKKSDSVLNKIRRASISISKDLKLSKGGKHQNESSYLSKITGSENYRNFLQKSKNDREHSPRPSNIDVRRNYVKKLAKDAEAMEKNLRNDSQIIRNYWIVFNCLNTFLALFEG